MSAGSVHFRLPGSQVACRLDRMHGQPDFTPDQALETMRAELNGSSKICESQAGICHKLLKGCIAKALKMEESQVSESSDVFTRPELAKIREYCQQLGSRRDLFSSANFAKAGLILIAASFRKIDMTWIEAKKEDMTMRAMQFFLRAIEGRDENFEEILEEFPLAATIVEALEKLNT